MTMNPQLDRESKHIQFTPTGLLGHYAGFISRLIAFTIDAVIITIAILATSWFISVTIKIFGLEAFFDIFATLAPGAASSLTQMIERITAGFIIALFIAGYYVFFWVFAGTTPGKAFIGLRIITTDGRRISFFRALLRYFGYFLSAGFLFLGFVWVLIDDRRQGWHDKLAGTVVIYTWAASPDERFLAQRIQRLSKRSKNPPPPDDSVKEA